VIRVIPLTPTIGAEIDGVDLRQPLGDDAVHAIRVALLEHLVVVFRDQELTNEELLRFGGTFGPVTPSAFQTAFSDRSDLMVLDQTTPKGEGSDQWHADHTFFPVPPMGLVLRAVQLPSSGGDTCFASMYAAYDDLSSAMQTFLEGLTAVHDMTLVANRLRHVDYLRAPVDRASWPPVVHPVIRTHPETGRKLLNVNSNWTERIIELDDAESHALLQFLFEHLQSPSFQCRLRWKTHTVALLDNRAVQHFAVPDYHERRVMHRFMLGDDPAYYLRPVPLATVT
jgi:taurine dioxygenase